MILKEDLLIEDIGFKHTFTGDYFMIELNTLRIKRGFKWNGATFAHDGKRIDGKPITWKATCLHDLLYTRRSPLTRLMIDKLFYRELVDAKFKPAYIYYLGVRLFGWIMFKGGMKNT